MEGGLRTGLAKHKASVVSKCPDVDHPFQQVCRRDLCALETARYPIMHFTSASDSSSRGGKYILLKIRSQKFHKSVLAYLVPRNGSSLTLIILVNKWR